MTDINTHAGNPALDDPAVTDALAIYDQLTPGERREVFRTLYRAVTAFNRTGDIDRLVRYADSVKQMVALYANPEVRSAVRDAPHTLHDAGGPADLGEVLALLQE
jgi:hypothetical protein